MTFSLVGSNFCNKIEHKFLAVKSKVFKFVNLHRKQVSYSSVTECSDLAVKADFVERIHDVMRKFSFSASLA